jgi:hypothetical protein
LKIKHIRLKEQYGECEIPHESKNGTGPILLTLSFPYVRDWLNEHPFRNTPDARVICNLHNAAPVKPEAMWMMMKQLCNRLIRMLESEKLYSKFITKLTNDIIASAGVSIRASSLSTPLSANDNMQKLTRKNEANDKTEEPKFNDNQLEIYNNNQEQSNQ